MNLSNAITHSTTCSQFCQIFEKDVLVEIDTIWGIDRVRVKGYEGTVSTDFIASHIINNFFDVDESQKESAQNLENLLENKVFIPLRDKVIHLDKHNCCSILTYKIRNFTRICWTPDYTKLSAGYPCLKHSMCLLFVYCERSKHV